MYLAVVDNDKATILKRTEKLAPESEKQKKFKATVLEKACIAAGLINPAIVGENQMLDLVVVGENITLGNDLVAYKVLEIVKDVEGSKAPVQVDGDNDVEDVEVDETAMDTASAPADSVEDTDDF